MERFTLTSVAGLALPSALAQPRYNGARDRDAAVAVLCGGTRTIEAMRWGMLAPWRGHGGKRPPNVYLAPRDAIDRTPLLRNAFRTQRCLLLADGFFAWRRIGKKSQPYWLHTAAPIAFAALYTVHADDGRPSFAVVTVPAPPAIAPITADVPLAATDTWLASVDGALAALSAPLPALRADAVSTWVNDPLHDDPRCIAPLGNPAQGELF